MVGDLSQLVKRDLSLLTILNHQSWFLDEPTTGMDLEAVDNFWKLLEQQGFTSVVVTHDLTKLMHFYKSPDFKRWSIAATKAVEDIHQAGQTIEQYFREEMNKEGNKTWKIQVNKFYEISALYYSPLVYP